MSLVQIITFFPQVIDLQLTEVPSEKKSPDSGDPRMAERERGVDQ
jgi:hypothetical protein